MGTDFHQTVLLNETIALLNIKSEGVYVDCTYGGGGHTKGILSRLNEKGKVIAFDQDQDAQKELVEDKRLVFISQNFRYLEKSLRLKGIQKVDGILADLGLSSHQINTPSRGFSFQDSISLDMRMDTRTTKTALTILVEYSEEELATLFFEYGEIWNSRKLARHIVEKRNKETIENGYLFLKEIAQQCFMGNPINYLSKVFQALRIELNDELGALHELLVQSEKILNKQGRLAVISFHSLEDRMVKRFFKNYINFSFKKSIQEGALKEKKVWKNLTSKPLLPSEEEMKNNKRSRSAKLRVGEKIKDDER